MSLLGRITRAADDGGVYRLSDGSVGALLDSHDSYTGERVTHWGAYGLAPFWRGVTLRAESLSIMPCRVVNQQGVDQPGSRPWSLLHDVANESLDLTADEWWAIAESHVCTWGNHFSWMERGADNRVRNLWPLAPSRVQTGVVGGERVFLVDGREGFTSDQILHLRGLSLDGIVGYSPLQLHRHTLGGELSREKFKGRFWRNDARPGVALVHPQKLTDDALKRIKALWDSMHRGPDNAGKAAVLGEGVEIHELTMPMADAQFVEQARMGATQIALVLRVPPSKIGGTTGDSFTYTSVQADSVEFVKFSLASSMVRYQNAVSANGALMPKAWRAKFDPNALMQTTTLERNQAYGLAHWMLVDEIRALDGLDPLPDGKGQVLLGGVQPAQIKLTQGGDGSGGSDGGGGAHALALEAARQIGVQRRLALPKGDA